MGKHCTGSDTPTLSVPLAPQPFLPGAERQVQALLSKYGPEKLYQVTSNISGAGTLELTLLRGQIVALLQNKDTKGNSGRWLVDTGGTWGLRGLFSSLWENHPTGTSGETRVQVWAGAWLRKPRLGPQPAQCGRCHASKRKAVSCSCVHYRTPTVCWALCREDEDPALGTSQTSG